MSETEHGSLFAALSAAQGEMPTIPKDATNPHFRSKFAPLDTIVEAVAPILSAHGLAWSSFPSYDDAGNPTLRYTLAHGASGEREDGVMLLLLGKTDPQGQGSAITYARRYAISAVLNIVADEDVDGEGIAPTSKPKAKAKAKPKTAPAPEPVIPDDWRAGDSQANAFLAQAEAAGYGKDEGPGNWHMLRLQLAMEGVPTAGEIDDVVKSLTRAQFESVWNRLEEEKTENAKAKAAES